MDKNATVDNQRSFLEPFITSIIDFLQTKYSMKPSFLKERFQERVQAFQLVDRKNGQPVPFSYDPKTKTITAGSSYFTVKDDTLIILPKLKKVVTCCLTHELLESLSSNTLSQPMIHGIARLYAEQICNIKLDGQSRYADKIKSYRLQTKVMYVLNAITSDRVMLESFLKTDNRLAEEVAQGAGNPLIFRVIEKQLLWYEYFETIHDNPLYHLDQKRQAKREMDRIENQISYNLDYECLLPKLMNVDYRVGQEIQNRIKMHMTTEEAQAMELKFKILTCLNKEELTSRKQTELKENMPSITQEVLEASYLILPKGEVVSFLDPTRRIADRDTIDTIFGNLYLEEVDNPIKFEDRVIANCKTGIIYVHLTGNITNKERKLLSAMRMIGRKHGYKLSTFKFDRTDNNKLVASVTEERRSQ